MLNLIIGKSGSGKTEECYRILSEAADKKPMLIVPEQFEFETEKCIYRLVGAENFNKIEISTFTKLSDSIISRFSTGKEFADDVSKRLIMYKTLRDVKPQLVFYTLLAEKPSFTDMMLDAVSLMKSGGVSPEKLDSLLGEDKEFSENLNLKLFDLLTIYKAYNQNLDKSFSDRLDSTAKAAELARENNCFEGRTVFLDGFDGFSGSQHLLLQPIIVQSENMYLTVCMDAEKENKLLFGLSSQLAEKLSEYAESSFVKTSKIVCNGLKRFRNDELALLTDNLYQNTVASDIKPQYIKAVNAADYYAEAEYVCAEIRRLIITEGYRYNDILIMTTDNDGYFSPLDSTFEKYEIPAFIDVPETILYKPLVNLIMAILNVAESFTTESILRLTKTGFIRLKNADGVTKPLTLSQINELELFAYKWSIKGEDWKTPFPEEADESEAIRARLIPPLVELKNKLRNATGAEITRELCSYLFDVLDLRSSVSAHCKEIGNENLNLDKRLSEEYRQLWSIIADIFEAVYKCMSDYKINLGDYIKLMREIFKSTNISKPPQVMDSIMVGSIGRTRAADVKVLFVMGANDGKFPSGDVSSGFFTAREAEEIGKHGLEISESRMESFIKKRFMAYKAFSMPSERLYITYPFMDTSGETQTAAPAVNEVKKLVPLLEDIRSDKLSEEFYCTTRRAAQQRLARLFRHRSAEMRAELYAALANGDGFLSKLEAILRKDMGNGFEHRISTENAQRIFRRKVISSSKVDDLSKCRFMYFCKYGLDFKEPERVQLDFLNIGNIVHFVLQGVLSEYSDNNELFLKADETTLAEKTNKYLDEYRNSNMLGDMYKTKRFIYLYSNLGMIAVAVLKHLQREFGISNYRPRYFEVNITDRPADGEKAIKPYAISVKDIGKISITGKIDRVDVLQTETGSYVRVIDYKTGSKEFDINNVYYGLNTQMLMYLYALCESEGLNAGGVAYYPAGSDKLVSGERGASEMSLLKAAMQSRKMSGIHIDEEAVKDDCEKLDSGLKEIAGCKAKMTSYMGLSSEQFSKVKEYITAKISDELSDLYGGNLDAVPLNDTKKPPCDYCDFRMICGNEAVNPSIIIEKDKINEVITKKEECADGMDEGTTESD